MKMVQSELVTIGIPTYSRAELVIESIESCLAQDYPNIEIVVSDNASPDNTESAIQNIGDERVKYHRFLEPVEPYRNWNNCIAHASGHYMTLLSDDDLLDANFISTLVAEFKKHPHASLVRGSVRCIDINRRKLWEYSDYPYVETPEDFLIQRIKNRRRQFLPGFMFKTDVINQVGMFENNEMPNMLHLDDYFWFKLAFTGNAIVSSKQAYWNYRTHCEQYGGSLLDIADFALGAVHYIDRLYQMSVAQNFSDNSLGFLKKSYLDSMMAHRVFHEERRMSEFVKSGLSVAKKKNGTLAADGLLVVGAGPSIKGVDFQDLSDCPTLAVNYSYKAWLDCDWAPTYYLSNDYFHATNDPEGILVLVNGPARGKTKKFVFRKNVLALHPELADRQDIAFVEDLELYRNKALLARLDSAGIAVLYGIELGFSRIYTIGVDLLYSARNYEPSANRETHYKVDAKNLKLKGHFLANYYQPGYLARRPRGTESLILAWQALRSEAERKGVALNTTVRNSLLHGILEFHEYFNEPGYDGESRPLSKLPESKPDPKLAYRTIKPMIEKCKPFTPGEQYPDYMKLEENRGIPVDLESLRLFKNLHKGQRCFIIGNGPSLNKTDLSKLKNEVTFGVNSIFLMTDLNGFIPTYYSVCDSHVIAENVDRILDYPVQYKFFPSIFRKYIPSIKRSNVSFFMMNRGYNEVTSPNYSIPRFSADISERVYDGQTITYINLQMAYYMGFSEVYLIGVDFSYVIPDSAIVDGANITSTEDDPNHFHPDYFGKGRSWHDPVLHRVIKNYQFADMVFKWDGRIVYNATVGGNLEAFERADYYSLFD